ncbi:MAG TPA: glycerol-3-phosphate 1-O-acyltransferase PlsY [Roseiarcus sp.]|nr:glycerol-3-phosphate 1-O-acyltransferase PlsY [Roseiarcus sp.]
MVLTLSPAEAGLCLAFGYLLGSIPFGLLLTRAFGAGDLRKIGSGNIGATNVLRTGRKDLAAATLLLDACKAGVAYVVAALVFHEDGAGLAAAAGAFLGHLYPVWLGFKGGKGVATFIGGLVAACWPAALAFAAVWLAVAVTTRYSSASALAASLAAPLAALALGNRQVALTFAILAALIWMKHVANIRRLASGTEPRIGAKA